ncbi:C-type lectin domain family 5 member A isoform X2 [Macrotis lagotis]|uniref:C-type lectin domain family 5 member A isoform X2 n=1 Tax=Macrotis lagotis TaxID=92651 RepID=UPI003D69994F
MAFVNCHMIISTAIVVTVKVVGTTFFLIYLPEIFPPVLKENSNSISTERSVTVSVTSEESSKYTTTEYIRTDCPILWHSEKGRCYFFSIKELNWNNSQIQCFNEGATLAIINNIEEQNFLQSRAGLEEYFIGLRYQRAQKRWQWTDGSGFMVSITNDPQNFECGIIGVSQTVYEASCEVPHRWICEK